MSKDVFSLENSIEKLKSGNHTDFLMPNEVEEIKYKLKKVEYDIYKPYKESDKVLLYSKNIPQVILYKINSKVELRHQDVLGSLFALGISNNTFGDIIVKDNNAYFYILPKIEKYIENYFNKIGKNDITLEKVDLELLEEYEKEFISYKVSVSSLRIDNIVKAIIKKSRNEVIDLISNKDILINYNIVNKNSLNLNEGDIISIRHHGKYKFTKLIDKTKKDKLIIEYIKYI